METCLDIQNAIEAMKPSSTEFSFVQRGKWINDVCKQIYHDVGVYKTNDYRLSTILRAIDLSTISTQIRVENVVNLWVTATKTTISSNITSTQSWLSYDVSNITDLVMDNRVLFPSYFADERMVRVKYLAIPALFPTTSTDSTSIPDIQDEAVNAVKYGALIKICKAGDAPDVQLANAYTHDFREEMKRCKNNERLKHRKTDPDALSYKEWNW